MMIGDSVVDYQTGKGAGVHICLARYGFGFHNFPLEQVSPHDRVIDRPLDLLKSL